MRVLITGSTGFMGSELTLKLAARGGYSVRAAMRRPVENVPMEVESVLVGDLAPNTDWSRAVNEIDAVVHTAARVHVMRDKSCDSLSAFRRVNVDGTLALAAQAAAAGIRRFVFMSSVKVNGEETACGKPFGAEDVARPVDPYAISKFEAEAGLKRIAAASGMEVVVIRPPLVYGPGVKANFLSMMRWLYKGIPLPFGAATNNKRSLVALDNLVDLIVTCLDHPAAANQTFLAGDGEDLSTAELLTRLGNALGRPARLIPVPPAVLTFGARLIGRHDMARRLLGSLQVDIGKIRDLLGWRPLLSVDAGLEQTAHHFMDQVGK